MSCLALMQPIASPLRSCPHPNPPPASRGGSRKQGTPRSEAAAGGPPLWCSEMLVGGRSQNARGERTSEAAERSARMTHTTAASGPLPCEAGEGWGGGDCSARSATIASEAANQHSPPNRMRASEPASRRSSPLPCEAGEGWGVGDCSARSATIASEAANQLPPFEPACAAAWTPASAAAGATSRGSSGTTDPAVAPPHPAPLPAHH
jgi:hypothetical protein